MPLGYNKLARCVRHPQSIIARLRARCGVVKNVFATTHAQTALLSYLAVPFLTGARSSHTNQQEALCIAQVLNSMGFNVDVCDYTYAKPIDYSNYDFILGFGCPLNNAFRSQCSCHTVYYGTGMHVCHQNTASLKRAKAAYSLKKVWMIDSCRVVDRTWSEQTALVDGIITLGTDSIADSYRNHFNGPVLLQPASYNASLPVKELHGKDWGRAGRHFLWFGSVGALHKGLDLLLAFFSQRPNLTLHICSQLENEPLFMQAFTRELSAPNIRYHGFVDVHSPRFTSLMHQCAFTVLPSCSEGQATSVLNTACNGLIPVVTPFCGLEVKEYGISIDDLSISGVTKALERCCAFERNELEKRSIICLNDIRATHSLAAFHKAFRANLEQMFAIIERGM